MNIVEQYIAGKSMREIAAINGVSRGTIRNRLIAIGVELRKPGQTNAMKNQFDLTDNIKEVIDGELLGDGSMYPSGDSGGFVYCTSKRVYIEWLYFGIFKGAGIITMKDGITTVITKPRAGFTQKKDSVSYRARTLSYLQFGTFRRRWYRHDGIKIVPDDLIITPTVLLHWYLGDGSLHKRIGHHKTRGKYSYIYKYLYLHTNGFTKEESQKLADRLNVLGFVFKVVRHNSNGVINYQLALSKPSTYNQKFFDYMGDCPEPLKEVYGYKWNWHTTRIDRANS